MMSAPGAEVEKVGQFVQREFAFSERDFQLIASMLRVDAGIVLEKSKMPLVYARLARRVRALGLRNFGAYCVLLTSRGSEEERIRMREALTTNVTRFFRESHHFDHLRESVLPRLVAQARRGKRVRLWSAGCATGEEPYSIALTVLAAMPDAARFDFKILATDIDGSILKTARLGAFSRDSLDDVDDGARARWFDVLEDDTKMHRAVGPEMRELVAFRRHNLIGEWPMKGPFQAIFCRNTVIYFDGPMRNAIWTRMGSVLSPGGYLYLGHSERIPPSLGDLAPVGPTVYRKLRRPSADSAP
jgi:chemotaxis protein methyltransferase CheR